MRGRDGSWNFPVWQFHDLGRYLGRDLGHDRPSGACSGPPKRANRLACLCRPLTLIGLRRQRRRTTLTASVRSVAAQWVPCAMPATDVTGGGREVCGVEITAMWSVPSIQHVSSMVFGLGSGLGELETVSSSFFNVLLGHPGDLEYPDPDCLQAMSSLEGETLWARTAARPGPGEGRGTGQLPTSREPRQPRRGQGRPRGQTTPPRIVGMHPTMAGRQRDELGRMG